VNSTNAPSPYPVESIAGADGAASDGVALEKVFDDLIATTRDRTPTCGSRSRLLLEISGLTGHYSRRVVDRDVPLCALLLLLRIELMWRILDQQSPSGQFVPSKPCQLPGTRL
jgi:hypothetical protein